MRCWLVVSSQQVMLKRLFDECSTSSYHVEFFYAISEPSE